MASVSGNNGADTRMDPRSLRVVHLLAGGAYGGLESVVSSLTRGLRARGHDCRVVAILDGDSDARSPLLDELRAAEVLVVPLRVGNRAYLRERRALSALFTEMKPDVVHTHGYRADFQGIAAARRAGFPAVSTVHGFTGGDWKNSLFEWLQERSLARADRVAAVSRPIVARLVRRGVDASRIRWIANAWEPWLPPMSRAQARQRLGLASDQRVVGWVGRLSPEKGADVLVRAMASVTTAGAVACLVGDGPERDRLDQLGRELGISDRLYFAGSVPQAARVYGAFDVFCLSSRTEGTPIALLEAMNARVPIVATRVGGVPDVVGDAEARLVDSEDPPALAGAIDAACSSAASSGGLVEAAAQRLQRDFAIAPWIDRYLQLYAEVAGGVAARSASSR